MRFFNLDVVHILEDSEHFYDLAIENPKSKESKSLYRILNLIENLPSESLTMIDSLGGEPMNDQKIYLARMLNTLELLFWAKTKDGERGRNQPSVFLPSHIEKLQQQYRKTEEQQVNESLQQKVAKAKSLGITMEEFMLSEDYGEDWS